MIEQPSTAVDNDASTENARATASSVSAFASDPVVSGALAEGEMVVLPDLQLATGEPLPDRDRVEPHLAALLQAEHLNLLVGSGLTNALAHVAEYQGGADMEAKLPFDDTTIGESVEQHAALTAKVANRGVANIEDRLRVAMVVAEGLRYAGDTERSAAVQQVIADSLANLRAQVASSESALLASLDKVARDDITLRGLLISFLGSFAARTPTRDRLHIFTTNYDRVIEWGADMSGLRIIDRFVGSLEPIFRSSRLEVDYHYSPPGTVRDPRHLDGVVRLTKLHGSLDWNWVGNVRQVRRSPLPFGAEDQTTPTVDLLIYPNSAKDMETTFYPYADLFRDFSAAICRPHAVLVTYGYGFGDDHVNRIIRDMLTIPSTHLLAISFDDPGGRISRFVADHRRLGQVSLMIGKSMGSLPDLVGTWLPWPSAEFLLHRKAQIYRDRGGSQPLPTAVDAHLDAPS